MLLASPHRFDTEVQGRSDRRAQALGVCGIRALIWISQGADPGQGRLLDLILASSQALVELR